MWKLDEGFFNGHRDVYKRRICGKFLRLHKKLLVKKCVSSLKEEDLKGKKVFVRADLNVPLDHNHNITDDARIKASVDTIQYLMKCGSRVILASHLGSSSFAGHPIAKNQNYSLKLIVPRLSELLGVTVEMANDCIGPEVEKMVSNMPSGGVLVLENLRFHRGEVQNDLEFAKQLASLADLYVNDCFRNAYIPQASTKTVADYLKPAVAGLQMKKELRYLFEDLSYPETPFVAIVGGSKFSAKIGVIDNLLDKRVNHLLLGGGLIFTFFKAQGYSVGSSLVEEDMFGPAESLYIKAARRGVKILFPDDVVIADWFAACAEVKHDIDPSETEIPDDWIGVDIGRKTIDNYSKVLDSAKTIIWSGPMGVYEIDKFSTGTKAIAEKLAGLGERGVKTIIAGDDTVAAVKKMGLADKMTHISMGEPACLQLLEGIPLPAMLALDDDPVEKEVPEDDSDDDYC